MLINICSCIRKLEFLKPVYLLILLDWKVSTLTLYGEIVKISFFPTEENYLKVLSFPSWENWKIKKRLNLTWNRKPMPCAFQVTVLSIFRGIEKTDDSSCVQKSIWNNIDTLDQKGAMYFSNNLVKRYTCVPTKVNIWWQKVWKIHRNVLSFSEKWI